MKASSAFPLLACVCLLAYSISLTNRFVWDDDAVIAQNRFISSAANIPRLFSKSYLTGLSDLEHLGSRDIGSGEFSYRPVVTASYFADYSLWKLNPFGYHLTNVFLHILNACLLFVCAGMIIGDGPAALAAALLFSVHPVNMEAVNVVSFREDLLVFLFFVSALALFIKGGARSGVRRAALRGGSLLAFLLALFSKETAMVFPAVVFCYDRLFAREKKKDIGYYLGAAAVLIFYCFVRFVLMNSTGEPPVTAALAVPMTRLATMCRVLGVYFQWLLVPVNVHATLPDDPAMITRSLLRWGALIPLAAVAAIIFLAVRRRARAPVLSLAAAWFFLCLLPASNLLFPVTNYLAARYLYLPLGGFCLAAAYFLSRFRGRLAWPVVPAVLSVFAAITVAGNASWKDNVVFWSGMARRYPGNAITHSSLAAGFRKEGRLDEAIVEYNAALRLDPGFAKDHLYLGSCFYEKGRFDDAIGEYKKALAFDPAMSRAYTDLGVVYGEKGLYEESLRAFERAVQLDSRDLFAYNGMGVTFARQGEYPRAKHAWESVLSIDPANVQAKANLRTLEQLNKK